MADSNVDRHLLLDELATEFAERYRRGERPALTEYIEKHPDLANEIREFFPAMVEIEVVKAAAEGVDAVDEVPLPKLEHLGDFRILREIGHGGMGVVYEAEQVSLGRRVALKLLTQRMLHDGVQKRRFEREAKAAARLHHTNIVPVFGSGEHEGTPYYVMQFIHGLGLDVVSDEVGRLQSGPSMPTPRRDVSEVARSLMTGEFQVSDDSEHGSGQNLRAVAETSDITVTMTQPGSTASGGSSDRHRRKLTYWQGVARIGVQVADALEYAHRQGIIHRDVKPSNLLLDLTGTVWVTDFGLAKSDDKDNLTRTGDMLGTLRYMPPEAFDGKSDARGDVYGLGTTLYEMLALRPAYDQHDRNQLIKAVTSSEPPRLRSVRHSVPRDLETIVHKAIDREPGRRYHSAAELGADLQRFLNDEPIKARDIATHERVWRWCRRYPMVASLLATVALVFLAGFAGVTWQWRVAEAARREANQTRNASALQAAKLLLDRGIEDARAGEPARALHLFVQALKALPADDPQSIALERVIRANITAWAGTLPALEHIWSGKWPVADQVAFTSDGERVAFAVSTDEVQCFRTDTGHPVGPRIKIAEGVGHIVEFTPNGRGLWVGSPGEAKVVEKWCLHLFDPETGQVIQPSITTDGPVRSFAVTPDGRLVVAVVSALHPDDRGPAPNSIGWRKWRTASVKVWEARSGRVVRSVDLVNADSMYSKLELSADAKSGIVCYRNHDQFECMTFPLESQEPAQVLRRLPPLAFNEKWNPFHSSIVFHHNLRTGVAVENRQIHRWSIAKPDIWGQGVSTSLRSLLISPSPDGRTIVSGSDGRVIDSGAWPPRPTGIRLLPSNWDRAMASQLAYSPDGRFTMSWDYVTPNDRRQWRMPRPIGRPPMNDFERTRVLERRVLPLSTCDNQGTRVVLNAPKDREEAVGNHVRVVDVATGVVRSTTIRHADHVREVTFSPDGRYFATASSDTTARVWDAATGRPAGPPLPHTNYVSAVAFSPDGNTLAAGDFGPAGLVKFWDWRTAKEVRTAFRLDDIVSTICFSPDGKFLAVVKAPDWSQKAELLVYDVATGATVLRVNHRWAIENQGGKTLFRPDSRAIQARNENDHLCLWELPSGTLLGEQWLDGDGFALFSPNGRFLAVGAGHGVNLLDGNALTPLPMGFIPYPEGAKTAAFNSDGSLLLTGSESGLAQLWDIDSHKPIGPPTILMKPIRAVKFTPDGKTCFCVALDETVRRWPVPAQIAETDLNRLANRVALMTGHRMGDNHGLGAIPPEEWRAMRAQLVGDGSTALVPPRSEAEWHDDVIADAKQDGDCLGAEWHLNRLAKLRPNDWTVAARHGRVLLADNRRDEADLAFDEARRLAPSTQVVSDWLRSDANDNELAEKIDAAMWNFDRAIALTPDDWTLYSARAQVAYKCGQVDRAGRDVDEMVRRGADDVGTLFQVAERAGGSGDWKRAAALFLRLPPTAPLTLEDRQHIAIIHLKNADAPGYRLTCANVPAPPSPSAPQFKHYYAYLSANVFTLGVDSTSDWSKPLGWIDQGLARLAEIEKEKPSAKEQVQQLRNKYLPTRGALLYRAGRFKEAAQCLNDAVNQTQVKEFHDWAFLALAEHRLGNEDAAKKAVTTARSLTKPNPVWEKAEYELLAAELERVVAQKQN